MKFMLNGALTIGTLDGANVEMREEAGAENFFLFGLTVEEVERIKRDGYRPSDYVERNPELAAVLESIGDGTFSRGDTEVFRPLVDNLRYRRPLPGARGLRVLRRMPGAGQRCLAEPRSVVADVDPQHGTKRQVLVRPGHRGVLRRHLERGAGDRHGVTSPGRLQACPGWSTSRVAPHHLLVDLESGDIHEHLCSTAVDASDLPALHAFVRGLRKDLDAVLAGLSMPYNNGSSESANTKVKLLKRQMYGRAGFALLRQRILRS